MIRLFLTDVDGVLTNSTYLVFPDGSRAKTFNTRDFYGMTQLNESGCYVGIITKDDTDCVTHQIARVAPFALFHPSVQDKRSFVETLIHKMAFSWEEVAFIGDDLNDLELLDAVGIAACPKDAVPRVLELVSGRDDGFIIPCIGGGGCVRDFADMILSTWYNVT
jgi:N-acylneuraminate cytidylyltransferase